MGIHRVEMNVSTGEREEIPQTLYKNEDGDVIAIDSIEPTPDGFEPVEPEDLQE